MKFIRTFLFLLVLPIAVWGQKPARYKQPRVLVLLDGSSSMIQPWNSKDPRFKVAASIVSRIMDSVYKLNDQIEFGLRVYGHQYPVQDNNCFDTKNEVMFSKKNSVQMFLRVSSIHPIGISPIAYSLKVAAENDLVDENNNAYTIILITDGGESCGGNICEVAKMLAERKIFFKPYIIGLADYAPLKQQYECLGTYLLANNEESLTAAIDTISSGYKQVFTRPIPVTVAPPVKKVVPAQVVTPTVVAKPVVPEPVTRDAANISELPALSTTTLPQPVKATIPVVASAKTVAVPEPKLTMVQTDFETMPAYTRPVYGWVNPEIPIPGNNVPVLPIHTKEYITNIPKMPPPVVKQSDVPTIMISFYNSYLTVTNPTPSRNVMTMVPEIAAPVTRPVATIVKAPAAPRATPVVVKAPVIASTPKPTATVVAPTPTPVVVSAPPIPVAISKPPAPVVATAPIPLVVSSPPVTAPKPAAPVVTSAPAPVVVKAPAPTPVVLNTPPAPKPASPVVAPTPASASVTAAKPTVAVAPKPIPPVVPKASVTTTPTATTAAPALPPGTPVAADNKQINAPYITEKVAADITTLEVFFTDGRGKFYNATPQMQLYDHKSGRPVKDFYRTTDAAGNPDPQKLDAGLYDLGYKNQLYILSANITVTANNRNKVVITVPNGSIHFYYPSNPKRPVKEFNARVTLRFEQVNPSREQSAKDILPYEAGNYYAEVNTLPISRYNLDVLFGAEVLIPVREPGGVLFTNTTAAGKVQLFHPLGDKYVPFYVINITGDTARQHLQLQPMMYEAHYSKDPRQPYASERIIKFLVKSNETVNVVLP